MDFLHEHLHRAEDGHPGLDLQEDGQHAEGWLLRKGEEIDICNMVRTGRGYLQSVKLHNFCNFVEELPTIIS